MQEPSSELPREYEPSLALPGSSLVAKMYKIAKFMGEDSDRRVFNRFDDLRTFVILRLQRRLTTLTAQLEDAQLEDGTTRLSEKALDKIAMKIERTLKEYDNAFCAQARFEQCNSPSKHLMDGFNSHCENEHFSILLEDIGANGVRNKGKFSTDKLAATSPREKTWIHHFIDNNELLTRYFKTEYKPGEPSIYKYSESSIRRVEQTFVNISFCLLMVCPILALPFVESTVGRLVMVLLFLLLTAVLTSGILTSANNTGLAVLAGYGAILVFFLGVKLDVSS